MCYIYRCTYLFSGYHTEQYSSLLCTYDPALDLYNILALYPGNAEKEIGEIYLGFYFEYCITILFLLTYNHPQNGKPKIAYSLHEAKKETAVFLLECWVVGLGFFFLELYYMTCHYILSYTNNKNHNSQTEREEIAIYMV